MTSEKRTEGIEEKIKQCLFFILASMALFAYSLDYSYFIFDDYENIIGNPRVPPQSVFDFLFYWKDSSTPIAYNIWQVVSLLNEPMEAFGFRLFNVFAHGGNAFLVYLTTSKLYSLLKYDGPEVVKSFALFSALFFLFSPLQVESVVWVSNGRGIFATSFFLLALCLHLKQMNDSASTIRLSVISCFVISVLIKPSTIIFPGFLLMIEKFVYKKSLFSTIKKNQLYFYPALGFSLIHMSSLLTEHLGLLPWWVKALNACESLQHYFVTGLFPYDLSFNYGLSPLNTLLKSESILSFAFPVAFTVFFLALCASSLFFKRLEGLAIPLWCFLLSVLPTLGLIPFDFQNISTVSDRYLYIALIPLSWLLFVCIQRLLSFMKLKMIFKFVNLTIVMVLFLLSFQRINDWSNPEEVILGPLDFSEAPNYIRQPILLSWVNRAECKGFNRIVQDRSAREIVKTDLFANYISNCLIKRPDKTVLENYLSLGFDFIKSPQTIKNFIELSSKAKSYHYFSRLINHGLKIGAIDRDMASHYIEMTGHHSRPLVIENLLSTLEYFYIRSEDARAYELKVYLEKLSEDDRFWYLHQEVDKVIRRSGQMRVNLQ